MHFSCPIEELLEKPSKTARKPIQRKSLEKYRTKHSPGARKTARKAVRRNTKDMRENCSKNARHKKKNSTKCFNFVFDAPAPGTVISNSILKFAFVQFFFLRAHFLHTFFCAHWLQRPRNKLSFSLRYPPNLHAYCTLSVVIMCVCIRCAYAPPFFSSLLCIRCWPLVVLLTWRN